MASIATTNDPLIPPKKKSKSPQIKVYICEVTVSLSGNATGIDCNGYPYSDGVFGQCTKSNNSCSIASSQAQTCAIADRNAEIAARNAYHANKCGG